MMPKARQRWRRALLLAGLATLVAVPALPGVAQEAPESLLPPGFGAPPTTPEPPRDGDQPAAPEDPPVDEPATGEERTRPRPRAETGADAQIVTDSSEPPVDPLADPLLAAPLAFDVPTRRSLAEIGVIGTGEGGMPREAFGAAGGAWLGALVRHIDGPLVSRWGNILARRTLLSRTATPANIAGQDWTAERAWLLLRMGEAAAARALVQQVDAGRYTPRLYDVAMQVMLANADPAGMCPLVEGANNATKARDWRMARAICASLTGEQGRATALLGEARRRGTARGIDYLLAEKAVGAGFNSRRSVKIEWENVEGLNAWRVGLGLALGVDPPERLYRGVGPQVQAWRALAPSLDAGSRLPSGLVAARLGVLSNAALVEMFAAASAADAEAEGPLATVAEQLGTAYTAADGDARLAALRAIWNGDYARLVLTARAATTVAPGGASGEDAERLIAAMLSAGLDVPAARWAESLDRGSRGWAMLAVGAPDPLPGGSGGAASFAGEGQAGAFLVAGLAGLGRLPLDEARELARDNGFVLMHRSRWSRAIDRAASRGEQGTVALLAAAGLQGTGWQDVPAWQLYHIIRALTAVGLEAEARMIAAEAVTRA